MPHILTRVLITVGDTKIFSTDNIESLKKMGLPEQPHPYLPPFSFDNPLTIDGQQFKIVGFYCYYAKDMQIVSAPEPSINRENDEMQHYNFTIMIKVEPIFE